MKTIKMSVIFLAFALSAGCGGEAAKSPTNTANSADTSKTSKTAGSGVNTPRLGDPKGSIEYQLDLVKAGDFDKLKECFTDRVKESLTKETVDKAKEDASKYTMDDLYASTEDGEMDGKKTKKVKMKNGRTLTTLVATDGKWLADTIWFK